MVIMVDELENSFSERVSLFAETDLRVLKSRTQRVPPLDLGTSVSEPYLWHSVNFFLVILLLLAIGMIKFFSLLSGVQHGSLHSCQFG